MRRIVVEIECTEKGIGMLVVPSYPVEQPEGWTKKVEDGTTLAFMRLCTDFFEGTQQSFGEAFGAKEAIKVRLDKGEKPEDNPTVQAIRKRMHQKDGGES